MLTNGGLTLTTQTNLGTSVTFSGAGEPLTASGGQTGLTGSDGDLTKLSFGLTDPTLGFTTGVFRVDPTGGTSGATSLTITGIDQFGGAAGTFTNTLAIPSNGFFNLTASGGELIKSISFTANGQLDLVDQVRIGGVANVGAVPEPSTWAMMVIGLFGVGFMAYRRKQNGHAFRLT